MTGLRLRGSLEAVVMWAGLVSQFSGLGEDVGSKGSGCHFELHPHRLFLLAIDFIPKLVFILHWTICYTLCNLKFLLG